MLRFSGPYSLPASHAGLQGGCFLSPKSRGVSASNWTNQFAKKSGLIVLAIALLAAGALLLTPLLTSPMGRDQGVFAAVADVISRGGAPYRDAWDMKPPAIFYVFRASFALFGRSEASPRLLDLLWTLATAFGVWALARRLTSTWAGIFAGLALIARYMTHDYYWHTTQNDGFASLPLVLAALALVAAEERRSRRWAVAAGAFVGAAMAFKFTLGIFLVLPLIAALTPTEESLRTRLLRAGSYVLGCAVVLGAVCAYMWRIGALGAMLDTVVVWNSGYAGLRVPGLAPPNGAAETLSFLLGTPPRFMFPIGLLAVVGAIDLIARPEAGRMRWFLPAWALTMVVHVWLQGRFYDYHWLPVLPPLALLSGQGLRAVAHQLARTSLRRSAVRAISVAGLLVVLGLIAYGYYGFLKFPITYLRGGIPRATYLRTFDRAIRSDFSLVADSETAAWLRDHTAPDTPILIWGFEPLIYFLADRPPASRFIYTVPLVAPWSPAAWRSEFIGDIARRRPAYILVVHNDAQPWMVGRWDDSASQLAGFPELVAVLREQYRFELRLGDFDVWERRATKEEDGAAAPAQSPI